MKKINVVDDLTSLDQNFFNTLQNNVEEVFNGEEAMGSIVVEDISCKNLFNKYDVSPGYVKMEDGEVKLDYANVHSGYIDISGCSSLICPQISNYIHGGAFYNENKVFVSGFSGSQIGSGMQVPNGAKYIRINSQNSLLDTQQLERGTTATPYTPYKEYGEVDSGEITIIENLIKVVTASDSGRGSRDRKSVV